MKVMVHTTMPPCSECGKPGVCAVDCPKRKALKVKTERAPRTKRDDNVDLEPALKLFDAGVGSVVLAKDFGVSAKVMSEFLKANGREVRRGRKKQQ